MVNVLLVCPALIVTLRTAGLSTLALLLDRVITVSCGAAATNFTVPVTLLPPLIVLGLKLTDFTPATTLVSASSVLFDKSGSGSLAVTLAMLVTLPATVVFTTILFLTAWPIATLPMP